MKAKEMSMGQWRLDDITKQIQRLDSVNPLWREHFDPDFIGAIQRAMHDYSELLSLEPETAREAKQISDALLYLSMSIYSSIERVIERKKLRAKEEA